MDVLNRNSNNSVDAEDPDAPKNPRDLFFETLQKHIKATEEEAMTELVASLFAPKKSPKEATGTDTVGIRGRSV